MGIYRIPQELSAPSQLPQHIPHPWKGLNTHRKQSPTIGSLSTTEPNIMDFKIQQIEQTKFFNAWLLFLQRAFLKGLKEHVLFAMDHEIL